MLCARQSGLIALPFHLIAILIMNKAHLVDSIVLHFYAKYIHFNSEVIYCIIESHLALNNAYSLFGVFM
jgi:hypothetical protein